MGDESLPMEPPEADFVTETYELEIPQSDRHLDDPEALRKHAASLLQKKLGDEVQVTSVKVKRPSLRSKAAAKISKKEPKVKLFITTKF